MGHLWKCGIRTWTPLSPAGCSVDGSCCGLSRNGENVPGGRLSAGHLLATGGGRTYCPSAPKPAPSLTSPAPVPATPHELCPYTLWLCCGDSLCGGDSVCQQRVWCGTPEHKHDGILHARPQGFPHTAELCVWRCRSVPPCEECSFFGVPCVCSGPFFEENVIFPGRLWRLPRCVRGLSRYKHGGERWEKRAELGFSSSLRTLASALHFSFVATVELLSLQVRRVCRAKEPSLSSCVPGAPSFRRPPVR